MPSQALQLSERFAAMGLLKEPGMIYGRTRLDKSAPVFNSLEEFVAAQSGSRATPTRLQRRWRS